MITGEAPQLVNYSFIIGFSGMGVVALFLLLLMRLDRLERSWDSYISKLRRISAFAALEKKKRWSIAANSTWETYHV